MELEEGRRIENLEKQMDLALECISMLTDQAQKDKPILREKLRQADVERTQR